MYPIAIGLFLGSESLGLYAILISIIYLATLLNDTGIAPAALRFVSADITNQPQKIISVSWSLWIIYLLVISTVIYLLRTYLGIDTLFTIIIVMVTIVTVSIHRLIRKMMQGTELFQSIAKFEYLSLLCMLLSIIILSFISIPVSGILLLFIPINIYHGAFAIFGFLSTPILKAKPIIEKKLAIQLLKYGSLVGLGSLFSLGLNYIQILYGSLEFSTQNVGRIAFWAYVGYPVLILSQSFSSILLPRVTTILKTDTKAAYQLVSETSLLLTKVIFSGLICIVFVYYIFQELFASVPIEYFLNQGMFLGLLYITTAGIIVVMNSLIPILSSYESRVIFNPLISLVNLFVTMFIWFTQKSIFGILVIPLGLLIGTFFSFLCLAVIIKLLEQEINWHIVIIPTLFIGMLFILDYLQNSISLGIKIGLFMIIVIMLLYSVYSSMKLYNLLKNNRHRLPIAPTVVMAD